MRPCPVCDARQPAFLLEKTGLRLVRCRRCAMVYADPLPPGFAAGKFYRQDGAAYYLTPAKLESDYADVRFERELKLFRRYCPGGAVLDVGCSTGGFLFQLGRRFPRAYRPLGTDLSGSALDHAASRGVPVVRGDFPRQDFAGQQFEAVTFWAVFEHLPEPGAFLAQAWSVLKPGGLCFVLVPNQASLAARLLGGRYRYLYPQHLNYFTKATLARLIGDRFEVLDHRFTHFNPVVLWQDWRGKGRDVSNEERAALLRRTTSFKQNPWLKPVKLAYRLAEAMLSRLGLADNLAFVLRREP